MIGNIVGAFIVILVAYTLFYPMLTQEVYNAINCNSTINESGIPGIPFLGTVNQADSGKTDSFGGAGGNYHFGGYSGEVAHKDFATAHAIYKVNQSIFLNPNCDELDDSQKQMLSMLPTFFIIAFGLGVIFVWRNWRMSYEF